MHNHGQQKSVLRQHTESQVDKIPIRNTKTLSLKSRFSQPTSLQPTGRFLCVTSLSEQHKIWLLQGKQQIYTRGLHNMLLTLGHTKADNQTYLTEAKSRKSSHDSMYEQCTHLSMNTV
jgi:hypothetical protein